MTGGPASNALVTAIRQRVAEDLAAPEVALLGNDDRREYARQQIFVHLDELAGELGDTDATGAQGGSDQVGDPDGRGPASGGRGNGAPARQGQGGQGGQGGEGGEGARRADGLPGWPGWAGTEGADRSGTDDGGGWTGRGAPQDPSGAVESWDGIGDAVAERALAQTVLDALFGMGRLQALIDNPDIENIDINGCDRVWVTFADGSKQLAAPVAGSDDELVDLVKSAASRFGLSERRFDLARPELDLRLPDGSRLSALMAVAARPCLSVRRHRYAALSLADLVELGTLDESSARFLRATVRARKNIVVAGAMNSGKTTLLRALAAEIPPRERIVTIEQAFELGLDADVRRHPDLVALEARPPNVEGEGAISVADLVRRALRMNADRVIVGEVLGDEVLPMLNAMSQGRSGSMCTIHADSSAGVFRRLASYAVQAPERLPVEATATLIAGAVHFVVFLDTEMPDAAGAEGVAGGAELGEGEGELAPGWEGGSVAGPRVPPAPRAFAARGRRQRFVSSVREVVDAEDGQVVSNEILCPGPDRRALAAAPLRPSTLDELIRVGYSPGGDLVSQGEWW